MRPVGRAGGLLPTRRGRRRHEGRQRKRISTKSSGANLLVATKTSAQVDKFGGVDMRGFVKKLNTKAHQV